ncbi:MAG: hypothetical protein GY730_09420 [bacterium]|nr:hypothetical protein [bacterium]
MYKIISLNKNLQKKTEITSTHDFTPQIDRFNQSRYQQRDTLIQGLIRKLDITLVPVDIIKQIKKYMDIVIIINEDLLAWSKAIQKLEQSTHQTNPIVTLDIAFKMPGQELLLDFKFKAEDLGYSTDLSKALFSICSYYNKEELSTIIKKSRMLQGLSNNNKKADKYYDNNRGLTINKCLNKQSTDINMNTDKTEISIVMCINLINTLTLSALKRGADSKKHASLKGHVLNIFQFFNVPKFLFKCIFGSEATRNNNNNIVDRINLNLEQKYNNLVFSSTSMSLFGKNMSTKTKGSLGCLNLRTADDGSYLLYLYRINNSKVFQIKEKEKEYLFNDTILGLANMTNFLKVTYSIFEIDFVDLACIIRNIKNRRRAFEL